MDERGVNNYKNLLTGL